MNRSETVELVAPIVATFVGVGFYRRGRAAAGVGLVGGGLAAAVIFSLLGNGRPLVALVALVGIAGGISADERGERPVGLAAFSLGFLALLAAMFYT